MEVAQAAGKYDSRQRALVYNRIDEGVEQNVGDRTINGFSSIDKQIDKEDKSRAEALSIDIHQSQAK